MKFDILTIFPKMFSGYLDQSMMKRAQAKKLADFSIVNIRDYTTDKHHKVDDRPFGGGPGMVLKVEPIFNALRALKIRNPKSEIRNKKYPLSLSKGNHKTRVILLSAKGKLFTQNDAKRLAKYDRLVFICGRYEGVDERVAQHLADEELSIGPYVLTGGELPALVITDAVCRNIPNFLGKAESLNEESYSMSKKQSQKKTTTDYRLQTTDSVLEYPQYTRPEIFSPKKGVNWKVPKVLLGGNHKKIEAWKKMHMK